MITIQDWIAFLPEEDKHIAFVGEHQSVTRTFLLTGSNWEDYKDWGFHLDMAFDLSTVTSRAERQLESTQINSTENITETQIKTSGNTTKERYTVAEVEVDCADETDIATLKKKVTTKGIQLVWTVLRQHTQLPGKLRATLRALGPDGQVKKSDLMVFEVEPAVVAEAAAEIPQSEFEAMEEHMDEMLDAVLKNAQMVEFHLQDATEVLENVEQLAENVDAVYDRCASMHHFTVEARDRAEQAAKDVREEVNRIYEHWPMIFWGFDIQRGNNWLNPYDAIHKKGQLANGLVGNDSTKELSLTGYIPVQEGDVLSYQHTDPDTGERVYGNLYAVCLFDADGEVNFEANQYKADEDGKLHEITIPAGVSFVRLTLYHLESVPDAAIVPGHDLIPFERYQAIYLLKTEGYDPARVETVVQPVRCVPQTLTETQQAQARANLGLVVDAALDVASKNPVQNQAVVSALSMMANRINAEEQTLSDTREELLSLRTDIAGVEHETVSASILASVGIVNSSLINRINAVAQRVSDLENALTVVASMQTTINELNTRLTAVENAVNAGGGLQ